MLALFRRFITERKGNVAMIFAIASVPLVIATGGVVDFNRAYQQRAVVQGALDSAALAAGKKVGLLTEPELKTEAQNLFVTNTRNGLDAIPPTTMSVSGATLTLSAELKVKTYFLAMIGMSEMTFDLSSQVTSGVGTLEIALVLDNSGSMAGSKIATLKTAANNLTTTLFNLGSASTKPDPVKMAVVPFAAAVNVGPQYANAAWIDTGAKGTYHADAMKTNGAPATTSNLDLFSRFGNASWGGCVEERPAPYGTTDDPPSTASNPSTDEKKTLFVPMFAADEPDNWTCSTGSCNYTGSSSQRRYNGAPSGSQSYNNYIPDAGGTCGSSNANWTCSNGNANCGGSGIGKSEEDAFGTQSSCKYGTTSAHVFAANVTVGGIPGGPNFMCTTPALTGLTSDKTDIIDANNALVATGATNILSGVMWGWRTLSPGEPFTGGRDYADPENKKIIVLMTDGANTYYPNSKFLGSWYGAYGYLDMGHLGTTSSNSSTLTAAMDARTLQGCQNAKLAGVTIYTVGFDINSGTVGNVNNALSLLKACASDEDKYFNANDNTALLAAFSAIGDSITQLRIAE